MNGALVFTVMAATFSLLPQQTLHQITQRQQQRNMSSTQTHHNNHIQYLNHFQKDSIQKNYSKLPPQNNIVSSSNYFHPASLNSIKTLLLSKPRYRRSFLKQFIQNRDTLIPLSFSTAHKQPGPADTITLNNHEMATSSPMRIISSRRDTFIKATPEKTSLHDLLISKLQFLRDTASTLNYLGHFGEAHPPASSVQRTANVKPIILQSRPKTRSPFVPNTNIPIENDIEIVSIQPEKISSERIRHLLETNQLSIQINRGTTNPLVIKSNINKPKINVNVQRNISNDFLSQILDFKNRSASDENSPIKIPSQEVNEDLLVIPTTSLTSDQEDELENMIIRRNIDYASENSSELNTSPLHSTDSLHELNTSPLHSTDSLHELNTSPLHSTDSLHELNTSPLHSTDSLHELNTSPLHSTDSIHELNTSPISSTDSLQEVGQNPATAFLTHVYNGLVQLPIIGNVFRASVDPIYRPLLQHFNPQIMNRDTDSLTKSSEIRCFGVLGCMKTPNTFFDPIFRPLNLPPEKRDEIDTKFYLYTRIDRHGSIITNKLIHQLINSSFDVSRPTKLIIHGYLDNSKVTWMMDMVRGFLTHGDYNVFAVDWSGGSMVLYPQATANIRVVGMEVAHLVNWAISVMKLRPEDVHIVGHSLGAHTAGYAGEMIPGLARITGLDPAEPFFQYLPNEVRLDPGDAKFVDVIHTDSDSIFALNALGGGFGMEQPVGHLDFYPNDGRSQPGCSSLIRVPYTALTEGEGIFEGLDAAQKELIVCNHVRAPKLFTDSLTSSCPYLAFMCPDYETFSQGECFTCGSGGSDCAPLGIYADSWDRRNRTLAKMYLSTNQGPHYCKYHYRLTIYLADPTLAGGSLRGKLKITLITENGLLKEFDLTPESPSSFPRGGGLSFLLENSEDLSGTSEALLYWSYEADVFNPLTFCVLLCKSDLNVAAVSLLGLDTHVVADSVRSRSHGATSGPIEVTMCHPKGTSLVRIRSEETVKISASPLCLLIRRQTTAHISSPEELDLPTSGSQQEGVPSVSAAQSSSSSTVLDEVIATIYTP